MERRKSSTGITQQNCTNIGYKCSRASCFCEANTMVGRVRLRNPRIPTGCLPVEVAAFHNDTTDCSTMTADEFCCTVYHDICAIRDWANQVRCCESAVYNERNAMCVCDFCNGFNINDIRVRVAQRFHKNCFCFIIDGCFKSAVFIRIYKCSGNAIVRQSVFQQVVSATVNGLGSYDIFTLLCQCLNGISNCCCTGSSSQCGNAAFQCGNSLFKDILCRVGQSAVDVAGIL